MAASRHNEFLAYKARCEANPPMLMPGATISATAATIISCPISKKILVMPVKVNGQIVDLSSIYDFTTRRMKTGVIDPRGNKLITINENEVVLDEGRLRAVQMTVADANERAGYAASAASTSSIAATHPATARPAITATLRPTHAIGNSGKLLDASRAIAGAMSGLAAAASLQPSYDEDAALAARLQAEEDGIPYVPASRPVVPAANTVVADMGVNLDELDVDEQAIAAMQAEHISIDQAYANVITGLATVIQLTEKDMLADSGIYTNPALAKKRPGAFHICLTHIIRPTHFERGRSQDISIGGKALGDNSGRYAIMTRLEQDRLPENDEVPQPFTTSPLLLGSISKAYATITMPNLFYRQFLNLEGADAIIICVNATKELTHKELKLLTRSIHFAAAWANNPKCKIYVMLTKTDQTTPAQLWTNFTLVQNVQMELAKLNNGGKITDIFSCSAKSNVNSTAGISFIHRIFDLVIGQLINGRGPGDELAARMVQAAAAIPAAPVSAPVAPMLSAAAAAVALPPGAPKMITRPPVTAPAPMAAKPVAAAKALVKQPSMPVLSMNEVSQGIAGLRKPTPAAPKAEAAPKSIFGVFGKKTTPKNAAAPAPKNSLR